MQINNSKHFNFDTFITNWEYNCILLFLQSGCVSINFYILTHSFTFNSSNLCWEYFRPHVLLFFHFFAIFFWLSFSSVSKAFSSCSVVISRYAIVVWIHSCPSKYEIWAMFIPFSSQCEALACLNWWACKFNGTSSQVSWAIKAYFFRIFLTFYAEIA